MDTPTQRFVLKFNTSLGRIGRINIPRACRNKTAAEVEASMNALATNGAVMFSGAGIPLSVNAAKIVETTRRIVI